MLTCPLPGSSVLAFNCVVGDLDSIAILPICVTLIMIYDIQLICASILLFKQKCALILEVPLALRWSSVLGKSHSTKCIYEYICRRFSQGQVSSFRIETKGKTEASQHRTWTLNTRRPTWALSVTIKTIPHIPNSLDHNTVPSNLHSSRDPHTVL